MDADVSAETITIRTITDVAELRAVEDLQMRVWGMPERDVVPLHHLLAASGAGGCVLGAFTPDGRLVGFCYGFAGVRRGRTLFYSHMAGVLTEFRDQEIGFRLKQAQREAALAAGFEWMVWTYDPLQAGNAYFNLHKLGAESRRYTVNYYGEMRDELNRGTDSDRLEVDWWLRDPRVEALMRGEASVRGEASTAPSGDVLQIDVPPDITSLRRRDPVAAAWWRETTRRQFLDAFAAGYVAVDVERLPDRTAYILIRLADRQEARSR
jgi:predicted GNAT superfamily acetyltransferase